jgi:hypothetical protein
MRGLNKNKRWYTCLVLKQEITTSFSCASTSIPNGPAWTLALHFKFLATIDKLMCEMEVTKPSEMFAGSKYIS